jgi:hypothetical protein
MVDDIQDLEEYRLVSGAKARRLVDVADARRFAETVKETEKSKFARQAFGNVFVELLRELNRSSRSYSAAAQLALFFEMAARGAEVTFGDLTRSMSLRSPASNTCSLRLPTRTTSRCG